MEDIYIVATSKTPEVKFESSGKLMIVGCSQPNNAIGFYDPLIEWAGLYDGATVNMDINLEYLNSMSSRKLLELLNEFDNNDKLQEFTINWYYETDDEDTLERGLLYEELLKKASFVFHEFSESA